MTPPLLEAVPVPQPPDPPLVGNNVVFYSVVGAALLAVLLLAWRLLRGRRRPGPGA